MTTVDATTQALPAPGGRPLPQLLPALDLGRMRRYREYLDYYEGRRGAPRRRNNARERALNFNYARAVVEKGAAYLVTDHRPEVNAIDQSPSQEGRRRASDAERALLEVWEENDFPRLDLETEIDTAVLGDGAFKVVWDEREQRVVVSAPDVQGLYAWWLGDDVRRLWRVAARYELPSEQLVARHGRSPRAIAGQRPETVEVIEAWTAEHFQLWVQGELAESRPNPYGTIPFVIYPNLPRPKQFWGVSDIEPLRESLEELNRTLTQLSRILELSGNPSPCWRMWRRRGISRCSRAPCGRSRNKRAPTCWTCCRAAACACTSNTPTSSTARCTTSRRRRASPSATGAATAPEWRCNSNSTRCCAGWRTSD